MDTTLPAARLASFIEEHTEALRKAFSSALPPEEARRMAPLLRDWLSEQARFLRGGANHLNDCIAAILQRSGIEENETVPALVLMGQYREQFGAFAAERGINPVGEEFGAAFLALLDRHVMAIAAQADRAHRDREAASRRRVNALVGSLETPLLLLSPAGAIVLANEAFSAVSERAPGELEGKDIEAVLHEEAVGELRRVLRQKRSSGPQRIEGALRGLHGERIPCAFQAAPLYDAQGRRDSLALVFDAAAARRGDGPFLLEALVATVDEIALPAQLLDTHGVVLHENKACQAFPWSGERKHRALCCHLFRSGHGHDTCVCESVLTSGKYYSGVVQTEFEGVPHWLRLVLTPLKTAGGGVHYIFCAAVDVTAEQRLVQRFEQQILAQQRSSQASQVAIAVAHQLRNPLGVMIGFAEILARGLPPERIPGVVKKVLDNGLRCKEIVEALLEFGQGIPEERAAVNVNALLETLVAERFSPETRQRLVLECCPDAVTVECVPEQMGNVFFNLIQNALRAASSTVRIETALEHNRALVRILDDGPGVPQALQDRIFQPFFTTHGDTGHVGLGLTLSQAVIRECGGRLYLERSTERGACFTVQLPPCKECAAPEKKAPAPPPPKPAPKRVLIVDDERDLTAMLGLVLELRGYAPETAADAAEAMERLERNAYDGLVLDIQLPGAMNGAELFRFVAATRPDMVAHTLFITADTMNFETRRFLDNVTQPFMTKPFLAYDFADKVDELFSAGA